MDGITLPDVPLPRVIYLQPATPPKPEAGEPCNGCGVCCASEPCPVGIWLSRSRHGPCKALRWDERQARYRCGALLEGGRLRQWLISRWISAGTGCDAQLQAQRG